MGDWEAMAMYVMGVILGAVEFGWVDGNGGWVV